MTDIAPFEDRAEMASDKWIELARRYLQSRVDLADARIDTAKFSLCEVMTGCPAHLGRPGNVAAWHLRIDGRRLTVEAGAIDDADINVRGDYHQALQAARIVDGDDEVARERARREVAHRLCRPGVEIEVRRTAQGAAAFVLAGLHDHLAKRTVEDPDLDARLVGLGLSRHAEELADQGYTILERAVSEQFADELAAAIIAASEEAGTSSPGMLLERGRIFEETALHPWLYALAEQMCGRGMLMGQLLGVRKRTGPGEIGLHTDYVNVRAPFPDQVQMCTAIWALEDFTAEAGSTWLVPSSQRFKRHPRPDDDLSAAVPLAMPKGSIGLWDGAVWHWQGARALPDERITLHSTYMQSTMRPYDDYLRIDPAILARNPPELATLAGHNDIFGKNTAAGQQRQYYARSVEVRREPA